MMTTSSSISVNPASPRTTPSREPRSRRRSRDFTSRTQGARPGGSPGAWANPSATRVVSARTPPSLSLNLTPMSAVGLRKGTPTSSRTAPAASKRNLVDRENRQHHSDDDEGNKDSHAKNDDRLQEAQHALEIGPHVGLERLGNLEQHVLEPARLLADPNHMDRQDRKRRLRLHAGGDGAAPLHPVGELRHRMTDCPVGHRVADHR